MKSLLEQEGRDDLALRISVQPGGCSGLRYQLFFDERTLDGDVVTDFDGVSVVVDRMSVPYLNGAMIDFVDTIEKQGFTIDNPNATGSCACGDTLPLIADRASEPRSPTSEAARSDGGGLRSPLRDCRLRRTRISPGAGGARWRAAAAASVTSISRLRHVAREVLEVEARRQAAAAAATRRAAGSPSRGRRRPAWPCGAVEVVVRRHARRRVAGYSTGTPTTTRR